MALECEVQGLVDELEAIDNNDDKVAKLGRILNSCGVCDTGTVPSTKKKGKKMSSWICYNKVCAEETGKKYMECVADRDRAQTDYYGMKDYWKEQANKGCPMNIPKGDY